MESHVDLSRTPKMIRAFFHASMGVVGAISYEFLLHTQRNALLVMAVICGVGVVVEVLRHYSPAWNRFVFEQMLGPIARPGERHRLSSALYYALGLFLAVALFSRQAACVGALVLALGDPAASFVGHRFGRARLWGNKSVIGTVTFLVVGALVSFGYLAFAQADLPVSVLAAAGVSAGVAGAAAELCGKWIDDNLTVPIAGALACAVWTGF